MLRPFSTWMLACAALLSVAQSSRSATCATGIHMMAAGGCHVPCPYETIGLMNTLISDITTSFPGSDVYYVPYNDSSTQGAVGAVLLARAAKQYAEQCPDTPIVFLGWSLGGVIVMSTVCQTIHPKVMENNVIAAISYGEETYVGGQSYDTSNCTNNAPTYPRNASSVAVCNQYASKIQDYCLSTDNFCCAGATSSNAHFVYNTLYDSQAFSFIQSQYSAFQKARK